MLLKKLKPFLNLLLLLFITVAAYAKNDNLPVYSDPSQTIIVSSAAPKFILHLTSNPTTGYSWFVKNYDKKLLKIVSHQYYPSQQQIPGKGGYEEWVVQINSKALQTNTASTITLVYQRPWEKTPVKKVTFKINVR